MKADPKKAHVAYQWRHTGPLIACAFDPLKRYLFTSSEDFTMQRWDLFTGKKIAWSAHDSWIRDIVVLPDGKSVITGACDDKIIFWPTTEAKPKAIREIQAHKGWIRCLSLSKDGKTLASGGNDNLVKLWDTSNGKLIREFKGHALNVYSVMIHPDGKHILSGDQGGEIRQWEIATGKLIRKFDAKVLLTDKRQGVRYGGVRGFSLSPDGKRLACCGLHKATNPLGAVNEPIVLQFDWARGKKVHTQITIGVRGIGWQVFHLNDSSLVCASGGSGGAYLLFWKRDEAKAYHKLKLPSTLRDMEIHPDGIHLATAHHDRQVRITKLTAKTPTKPKPKPKPKKK